MPTESCSWIASFAPHASSVVLSSTPVFRYEREARYGTGVVVESFGTVACIGPAPIDADQMQKYEQTERRGRVKILSIRRPWRGCAMSEMRLPLVRPHVGVLGATVREYVGASILETRAGNPWWIPPIEVSRMCGYGHRGLRRRHAFKTSARNRARWALGRPRVRILHTCNNPLNSEKALSIRGVTHGSGRNQPFRRAGGRVRGRRRSIGFA